MSFGYDIVDGAIAHVALIPILTEFVVDFS